MLQNNQPSLSGESSTDPTQSTSEITFEGSEEFSEEVSQTPQMTETLDGQGSEQDLTVQPAPGAVDFSHPLLKGKSPEEIQAIVQTMAERIDEQNRELNRYHNHSQASAQQSAPAPQEHEEPEDYENSFLASDLKRLEAKVTRTLSQQIAPLLEESRQTRAMTVREKLRQDLRHFQLLEPHIDQLLRQQGNNPFTATEEQLRLLYHTAVGLATERGINLGSQGQVTPPQQMQSTSMIQGQYQAQQNSPQSGVTPMGIPQHRPSSAPLPTPQSQQGRQVRQLTETERKLANYYGMTPEEYLAEMNKDIDEVVTPGFSKEGW